MCAQVELHIYTNPPFSRALNIYIYIHNTLYVYTRYAKTQKGFRHYNAPHEIRVNYASLVI